MVTVFVLLLVFPTVFADTEVQNHTITVQIGQSQEFHLYSNPTTGTSWWLEQMPTELEIVKLRDETDNSIVCAPEALGCGSSVAVFSVKGKVLGEYDAAFHLGHSWNHAEVYAIANLHVIVEGTVSTACMPNCIYPSIPDYVHCTCVSPTATTTPTVTTTTTMTSRTCPAQCTNGCTWAQSYPEQAFCITPNPTPSNPIRDALMNMWNWLRAFTCELGVCF